MTMTPIILAACVACTVYYHDAYVNMCARSLPHAACVAMWDGLLTTNASGQVCTLSEDGGQIVCVPITKH